MIYRELALPIPLRAKPMENLLPGEAGAVFREWKEMADKQSY